MINEVRSLKVSRRVFDMLSDLLEEQEEKGFTVNGFIDTFNNCRETGLCLKLHSAVEKVWDKTKSSFIPIQATYLFVNVWACEDRHSDDIMIIVSKGLATVNNMFTEDSYQKDRKHFQRGQYEEAAEYIMTRIKELYAAEALENIKRKAVEENGGKTE